MKEAWKTLTVLMIASPCYVLADANTPTDDVVKQQFAEQTGGVMRLQRVTLKQLDAWGNQATYMLEGDMAARDKKIAPLQKQKGELSAQLMALEIRYRDLARDEKYWQEGLEKMRRDGVLK